MDIRRQSQRGWTFIMALALAVLFAIVPGVTAVSISTGSFQIPSVGGTVSVPIILDSAPEGISGFEITVSLSDPSVATIIAAQFPGWTIMTSAEGVPGGKVVLQALGPSEGVAQGAGVTLATLTVKGTAEGSTEIVITPDPTVGVQNLDGDLYSITPSSGSLTVDSGASSSIPSTPPSAGATPIAPADTTRGSSPSAPYNVGVSSGTDTSGDTSPEGPIPTITGPRTPLSLGVTTPFSINNSTGVDLFTIEANAGDIILSGLIALSDTATPELTVFSPSDVVMQQRSYAKEVWVTVKTPVAGTYTLMAKGRGDKKTGRYTLFAQKLTSPIGADPLQTSSVNGAITEPGQIRSYTVTGQGGQLTDFKVKKTSGDLWPQLWLFGPQGDDGGRVTDVNEAVLSKVLPRDGTYLLLVRDGFGGRTGEYQLATSLPIIQGSSTITVPGSGAPDEAIVTVNTTILPSTQHTPPGQPMDMTILVLIGLLMAGAVVGGILVANGRSRLPPPLQALFGTSSIGQESTSLPQENLPMPPDNAPLEKAGASTDRTFPIPGLEMAQTSAIEDRGRSIVIDHDVIISYATIDKPTADAVCAGLEGSRIRCWIAPRDVPPGDNYAESIVKAIESSRILVLIFSSNANDSPHVLRELSLAVSRGVIIIPFRIEATLPSRAMEYFINIPHWLDAVTPPLEQHIKELKDRVQALLNVPEGASNKKP